MNSLNYSCHDMEYNKYFHFKKILRHDIANTNKKEISLFIFYLVHSLKLTQWITSYFIVYLYTWTSTYIFITKTQYIICQTGEHKTANKTSYVTSHHHRMTVCRLFLHLSHKSFTMSEHSLKKSLETKTCCNKCVSHTLKSFV